MSWLRYEMFQVRGRAVRVFHGVSLVVLLAVVAVLLVALGVFVGESFPYKTLPPPPVPKGQTQPSCSGGTNHVQGQCLPYPKSSPPPGAGKHSASLGLTLAAFTTGITGPDFSNNDPVYSAAGWDRIKVHSRFVYLKSVEGTGFYDGTAQYMAVAAKNRGLPVGGYDFMHVCGPNPSAEAAFFVRALRAQGLLGLGTLPPAADVEYGSGSCGGRSWVQSWVNYVVAHDGPNNGPGPCPIVYTGAWWWQPNIGSFWPTCHNAQLLTWISGYHVSYPYMPSGVSHLDFWQFADNGYNGWTNVDLSAWQHGNATFVAFAHAVPPAPPVDPFRFLNKHPVKQRGVSSASEYATVKGWDAHHCKNTDRHGTCGRLRLHMVLLRADIWRAVHIEPSGPVGFQSGPSWNRFHRRERFAILTHRVH